jgi:hypothetical protein
MWKVAAQLTENGQEKLQTTTQLIGLLLPNFVELHVLGLF